MVDESPNLGRRAVRGVGVTLIGQGVRVVTQLVGTVLLARLLMPADFGLMAIVLSVVAFGELVRDFGLTLGAARAPELTHGQRSNLFWLNTVLGAIVGAAVWASAGVVSRVFDEPALQNICHWMAVFVVLSGISAQFRAELNRDLRFVALAVTETMAAVLGLAVGVAVAASDGTYRALIAQQIAVAVVILVSAVAMSRWLPGLPRRDESVRDILRFGAGLFGTQLVAFLPRNADNLVLGMTASPATLGLYSRAYQLLMLPLNQLAAPLTRIAVPVLSRVRHDRGEFERYVGRSQAFSAIAMVFFYASMIGLAEPAVLVVFGPNWADMVPIFQLLAIGGAFRSLTQLTFWIFLALDESARQFRFNLWAQQTVTVLVVLGAAWGPLGVAVGHSVGYFVYWILSVLWCLPKTSPLRRQILLDGLVSLCAILVPVAAVGRAIVEFVPGPAIVVVLVGVTACAATLLFVILVTPRLKALTFPAVAVVRRHLRRSAGAA